MTSPIVRILLLGTLLAPFGVHASACNGQVLCQETATFVATLSDFRISKQGNNRIATATLSFQNKSAAPLILGYVQSSAVTIDDIGNRYVTPNNGAVRGIGVIERNTFDPKFTLQPGERSDARIDMSWYAGNSVAGVRFNFDFAVREIERLAGNQFRLGREHALQFNGLTDGVGVRNVAVAAPAVAPASPAVTVAPTADPCNGAPRCASNGPLVLEVTQVTTSQQGNNHHVRVTLRARNLTSERVIAAYQANSGVMLDNYGNRYTVDWRMNEHVRGIGQSSRQKADPQFALQPGEARSFTLEYSRYAGKTAIGTVYSPDLVLEQLEILPSQQIRSVRELNFNFPNLTAGNFGGTGNETLDAVQSINEAGKQLSEGLKSIFKKKD
jgi:hypothetical protein